MTSHNLLQQLHLPDRSSSEFHDKLCNILYGEGYKQSAPNLQADDFVCLVEYLDKVRRHVILPHLR